MAKVNIELDFDSKGFNELTEAEKIDAIEIVLACGVDATVIPVTSCHVESITIKDEAIK